MSNPFTWQWESLTTTQRGRATLALLSFLTGGLHLGLSIGEGLDGGATPDVLRLAAMSVAFAGIGFAFALSVHRGRDELLRRLSFNAAAWASHAALLVYALLAWAELVGLVRNAPAWAVAVAWYAVAAAMGFAAWWRYGR